MEFTYLKKRDSHSGPGRARGRAVEDAFSREQLKCRPVIRDELRNRYQVYESRDALLAAYEQLPDCARHWHEVVLGAQRIKFDIDAKAADLLKIPMGDLGADFELDEVAAELMGIPAGAPELTPGERARAVVNLVVEAILDQLAELFALTPSRLDIAISDSSGRMADGQYKFSYHILVLPYAVADARAAQEFTCRVRDSLAPAVRTHVDAGVNRDRQCFRFELSSKLGTGRVKRASDEVARRFGTAAGLGPADLFVTAASGMRILPAITGGGKPARDVQLVCAPAPAAKNCAISDDTVQAMLAAVPDLVASFRLQSVRGSLLTFLRVAPSHCQLCNEVHHKDNSLMLSLKADSPASACHIIEHCRQAGGKTLVHAAIAVPAGDLEIVTAWVREPKPTAGTTEHRLRLHLESLWAAKHDPHAALASQFESLAGDRRNEYSEPAMRNYELVPTLAVCAQMKLGKTKALRRYLDEHFAADAIDDSVIRFVSFRQTFGRALLEAFPDFTLYSDVPSGTQLGAVAYPRLIVQVESLHRLPAPRGANATVDLLILDEVESILAQFNSGLHQNFAAAFAIFQWMMANARHVIVMDANLSDRTWAVLATMRPAHPVHFHWNRFARAADDVYSFTTDQKAWLGRLWGALRAGQRVVVPTNSLAEARAIDEQIRREFPAKRVMLYSSELAPSERAKHFANVHEHWGALDVLVYTPTCSAGVSFELAHFDSLFGLFTDMSCDVETCRQMLGRVRNLNKRELNICLQTRGNSLPETVAEIRQHLCDKRCSLYRDAAAGPFAALGFEYDLEGLPRFYETTYFRLWLETTRMENLSKNNFMRRFVDQVADSGAQVRAWPAATEADAAASCALLAAHRDVRKAQRHTQFALVAAAEELTAERVDEVRAALAAGADVDAELRAAYEKWHLRAAYGWHGRPLTAEFVERYQPRAVRQVYKNLAVATGAATVDAALAAARAQEAAQYSAAMGMRTEQSAEAIEGRDVQRDRALYTAFGLTLALWLLRVCGFADFVDVSFVNGRALAARLRAAASLLAQNAARIVSEFTVVPPSPWLERERDDKLYTAAMLRFINPVLRAAFGVQIDRSGDSYYVAWSAHGALFELVDARCVENGPDARCVENSPCSRPTIQSALRPPAARDQLIDAALIERNLDAIYWAETDE